MDWGGDGGGRNYIGTGAEDPRGIPRRKVGGKVAARAGTAAYAAGENGESEWPRGAGAYSCPCARARARASEASSTRGRGPVVAIPPAEAEPIGFAVSRQRLGGWWGRGRSLLGLGIRWQTGGPAAWRGVGRRLSSAAAWVTRALYTHERRALCSTLLCSGRRLFRTGGTSALFSIAALWTGDLTVLLRRNSNREMD